MRKYVPQTSISTLSSTQRFFPLARAVLDFFCSHLLFSCSNPIFGFLGFGNRPKPTSNIFFNFLLAFRSTLISLIQAPTVELWNSFSFFTSLLSALLSLAISLTQALTDEQPMLTR